MSILFLTFFILLSAVGLGVFVFFLLKKKEQEYISKSLNMSLFLVTMPQHGSGDEKINSRVLVLGKNKEELKIKKV